MRRWRRRYRFKEGRRTEEFKPKMKEDRVARFKKGKEEGVWGGRKEEGVREEERMKKLGRKKGRRSRRGRKE